MDLLMAYSWPENVRELRSTFEYAFVTCQTTSIEPEDLPAAMLQAQTVAKGPVAGASRQYSGDREPRRKQELIEALREAEGNQSRAAEIL